MTRQAPQAAAAPVSPFSGGRSSQDTEAYRGEPLPFPLAADVPGRPWIAPHRLSVLFDNEETREALRQQLDAAEHGHVIPEHRNDVFWLIGILGAVPAVCLAVIAMVKVLG